MAFLFRESQRHGTDGQTDGRMQHLMRSTREDRITCQMKGIEEELLYSTGIPSSSAQNVLVWLTVILRLQRPATLIIQVVRYKNTLLTYLLS